MSGQGGDRRAPAADPPSPRQTPPADPRRIDLGVDLTSAPATGVGRGPAAAPAGDSTGDSASVPAGDSGGDSASVPATEAGRDPAAVPAGDSTDDSIAAPAGDSGGESASVPDSGPFYEWMPPAVAPPRPLAGIALWLAIAGLGMSLVVGWAFAVGAGAVLVGIVALRRPGERRGTAVWAIGLATLSLAYSAAWLVWAASRL